MKPTDRIRQEPPELNCSSKIQSEMLEGKVYREYYKLLNFWSLRKSTAIKEKFHELKNKHLMECPLFLFFFVGTMVLDLSEYFSLLRWWLSRDGLRSALDFQGLEGFPKWADLGRRACYAVEVGTGLLSNQIVQINHNGRKTFPKCKTDKNR